MELAEDEMKNFVKVWAIVVVSLCYCYFLGKITQKGLSRLLAILPIVVLFLILPLNLTSIHLTGVTSFFVSCLANLKLLLFAFGRGPLCSDPSMSLRLFMAVACLPIKIQQIPPESSSQKKQNPSRKTRDYGYPYPQMSKRSKKQPLNYIIKATLLVLMLRIYDYCDHLPTTVIWLIFCFHIYLVLEIVLAAVATAAKVFFGLELEPQFDEPFLATSLQDFWGRRWNLMVTSILRTTVYEPVLYYSSCIVGRAAAPLPAVFTTFVVSAVMHELVFYHLGRVRPTLEVTWFFLLHGFCLCVEITMKQAFPGNWRLHRAVSRPLTIAFVMATVFWLFLPPLLRCRANERGIEDYAVVGAFVRNLSRSLTAKGT
ncbi:hypothetical protein Nepgr_007095 [Nepenthes gracilis]|uniref:Wax synthase domain-containing protein n=1 Tax=Nepenthes gracilis TaxID=150966 RepID=A0AAD3S6J4_NEPGR|nr:hypothetical protein Nepgr_007095 [Nepenthes gracilis]